MTGGAATGTTAAMPRPILLLLILALAGPALAPAAQAQQSSAGEGSPPPYDPDLTRLSEILGALHYLRPLCGAKDEGQKWRNEMQALLDAEQPSDSRKGRLIAAFNRGYSSFSQVYRACTPAAELAVRRQMEESAKLAHDIVVRYGAN